MAAVRVGDMPCKKRGNLASPKVPTESLQRQVVRVPVFKSTCPDGEVHKLLDHGAQASVPFGWSRTLALTSVIA